MQRQCRRAGELGGVATGLVAPRGCVRARPGNVRRFEQEETASKKSNFCRSLEKSGARKKKNAAKYSAICPVSI